MEVPLLHIWLAFMVYNLIRYIVGYMGITNYIGVLLHTILLMDYKVALILVNIIGWYLILRRVKVEFSLKLSFTNP
jgi:hypothetical protein